MVADKLFERHRQVGDEMFLEWKHQVERASQQQLVEIAQRIGNDGRTDPTGAPRFEIGLQTAPVPTAEQRVAAHGIGLICPRNVPRQHRTAADGQRFRATPFRQ